MYDCMTVHMCIYIYTVVCVNVHMWLSHVEIKHYSVAYFECITCVQSAQNIRAPHLIMEFCARAL